MKKLIFLISAAMFLISCTRASNSDNAKIQIKLPDLTTSYSGKVGTLSEPTSLSDLNCYMVFVGGPEQDLRRNTCPTSGNSATGTPSRNINFGPLYGGFAPSTEISIEVPSGNDRVLHLVGMRVSAPEICRDFKAFGFPGNNESSKPFIIGTADRVLLEPSKTIEIPIKMAFNVADGIEKCTGPDVPQDNGGGGNSNEPYLRFEGLGKWSYPANKDLGTVGQCYQVRPSLYMNGSAWVDPGMNNIDMYVGTSNAGQFYSDSACSTPISAMQIPAGQSKSTINYYFKANTPAANVTFAIYSIIGNSVNLQNSMQVVDFGYPKLSFIGPDKLPQGLCAKYHVVSEYYEGGPLNATGGGLTISLSDNASFNLRANPGCSTGTSATIGTATSETDVYLMINSPATNVSFNTQATAPMYNSSAYTVSTSLRQDQTDSLQVLTKDSTIIRGVCNPITIRLVNSDGGATTAKNMMELVFKAPQGSGTFFTLPNCTGAPIGMLIMPLGSTEMTFGFKANSLPLASLITGKIPMQFHFGSIRIQQSLFNGPSEILFNVVDQNDPWFLHANPPSFNGAEIVGSHEFNDGGPSTFKFIPLLANYTNLTSIECSSTPGTGYSACSGSEVDTSSIPYKYKWSISNAASNIQRYVRFNFSENGNFGNREIKISSDALYGPKFKVIQCGYIASVNETIESISSTTSGVVCLPANSVHSRSSSQAFTFTASTRNGLIGFSDLSSELNGSTQTASLIYPNSTNSPDSNFYVANLKLRNFSAATQIIAISSISSSSSYTAEFNNIDIDDGGLGSSQALFAVMTNNSLMSIKLRNSKIIATGTSNKPVSIMNAKNITLENNVIEANGSDAIYFYNSAFGGENILFNNLNVKTTGGHAFYFSNSSVPNGTNNSIINSRFKMLTGGGINPVVRLTNKLLSSKFENNIVESESGLSNEHLMIIYSNTASQIFLAMNSNTFLQGNPNKSAVYIDGGTTIDLSPFHENSFVATAAAPNTFGFMELVTGTYYLNIASGLTPTGYGANLSCSTTAVNNFTVRTTQGGGANFGGNFSPTAIPLIANNSSLSSKRCSGP